MKALPVILFAIYISYSLGEDHKVLEKIYPKKYNTKYANGKILINYAKYDKTAHPPPAKYTAFQIVGTDNNAKMIKAGVPDSPYFPVDQGFDQKARVKKILQDYPWTFIRNKRSAVLDVSPTTTDANTIETKATVKVNIITPIATTVAKVNKEVTTVGKPTVVKSTPTVVSRRAMNTTNAKLATTNKVPARAVPQPVKKNAPVEKPIQPKPLPAAKKPSGRVNANPKSKARPPAVRGKPKGRQAKPKGRQAKPKSKRAKSKGRQAKSKRQQSRAGKKTKGNKAARNRNKKRNVNAQRNKNQKAKPKNARAGKIPKATRRLTAAREALIEDYPYVVSIQKDDQHWCAGALLNQRLVITTANCLWKATHMSRMKVRAGSRHSNRGGQLAGIQEVIKHPGWGLRKAPDNDVALLLLDKNLRLPLSSPSQNFEHISKVVDHQAVEIPVSSHLDFRFSDAVHGVDLPNRAMLPAFDDAWVTSWGAERRDGVYDPKDSNSLQVFHAQLLDREKCNNVTMRFSVIVSENFICLAQSGRQAPCTRDTGAPAVSDGILWGLASWGIRKLCGTERFPAVFSYLASNTNMDFIMNATHFLMSDKRQYPFADRYPESLIGKK